MPVHTTKGGGYQWGQTGKVYYGKGAKEKAEKQGKAIQISKQQSKKKWISSNSNLAPVYSAQKIYAVGDLCTYSGKLYKCIVAVSTPETFNINKWDDVTSSEAFAPNHEIIYQRTLTETVTNENVLADLLSHFSDLVSDLTKDLKLIFTTTYGIIVYNTDEINNTPNNGLLKFSRVNCSKGGIVYNEMIAIYQGDSAKVVRMTAITTDGTVSSSDSLSDSVLAGTTIRIIRG